MPKQHNSKHRFTICLNDFSIRHLNIFRSTETLCLYIFLVFITIINNWIKGKFSTFLNNFVILLLPNQEYRMCPSQISFSTVFNDKYGRKCSPIVPKRLYHLYSLNFVVIWWNEILRIVGRACVRSISHRLCPSMRQHRHRQHWEHKFCYHPQPLVSHMCVCVCVHDMSG